MRLLCLIGGVVLVGAASACGDKLPLAVGNRAQPSDTLVHAVAVSPPNASVAPGKSVRLAASVDAGAAAPVRTVVWTSLDTTVATVDTLGMVTAKDKLGTVNIVAAAKADPNVKGASTIAVVAAAAPSTRP